MDFFRGYLPPKLFFIILKSKTFQTVKVYPQHSLKINFFICQRLVLKIKIIPTVRLLFWAPMSALCLFPPASKLRPCDGEYCTFVVSVSRSFWTNKPLLSFSDVSVGSLVSHSPRDKQNRWVSNGFLGE